MRIYAINNVMPAKNVQKSKKTNDNPSFGSIYTMNMDKALNAKLEHSYYAKELFARLISAVRGERGFVTRNEGCIADYKFISDLYSTLINAKQHTEKIVLSQEKNTAKPIMTCEAGRITFHHPENKKSNIQFELDGNSYYVVKRPNNYAKFYLCDGKKETYDITPDGKVVNHKFFNQNGEEYLPTK